ncbi:hypothetical protein ACHAXA_005532 [Cyclostephanos tholiformis]|uniref:Uncharacterized protein n=1 Tax=Cyclostephanos tholiformis TaxID=382380 RepID=A0ABD3R973_9STRA
MSSFPESGLDEREAASIVAGLHSRISDAPSLAAVASTGVAMSFATGAKRAARDSDDHDESRKKPAASSFAVVTNKPSKARKDPPMDATGLVFAQPELKPAPFFYYSDHSLELDDDPLMPITAVGSVPTFPASESFLLLFPPSFSPSLELPLC